MMQTENAEAVAQILNLSPQQKSQLQPVLQAEVPKAKAILTDPSLSPSEKKKQLRTVHSPGSVMTSRLPGSEIRPVDERHESWLHRKRHLRCQETTFGARVFEIEPWQPLFGF
jgi:hypothetical protein